MVMTVEQFVEWMIRMGNWSTGRKPVPVPLCPPQIPRDLNWAGTRAAAVESRRLTARTTARPDTATLNSSLVPFSSCLCPRKRAVEKSHPATWRGLALRPIWVVRPSVPGLWSEVDRLRHMVGSISFNDALTCSGSKNPTFQQEYLNKPFRISTDLRGFTPHLQWDSYLTVVLSQLQLASHLQKQKHYSDYSLTNPNGQNRNRVRGCELNSYSSDRNQWWDVLSTVMRFVLLHQFLFVNLFYLQYVRVHSADCVKLTQRHVEKCSVALLCNW
jgi:hypothetical protein